MDHFMEPLWLAITTAFKGVPITIGVSAAAVVIGLVLGFVLAVMRRSKFAFVRGISSVYTDIVRGTPLVVQVFLLALGLPILIQNNGGDFKWTHLIVPAIICCGMNSAAYMGEIVRSGLQAVDKGQLEAAQSLGMTHGQSMKLVIVPQALRIILPPLGNEFVTMIKETAVLAFVGIPDMMRQSVMLASRTFDTFSAYLGVAIVYMIFTISLSKLISHMESRMSSQN